MIVYERLKPTAKLHLNGFETRSYFSLLSAVFEAGPQNRVRAATFAD